MKIEIRTIAIDDKKSEIVLGKIDLSQHIDDEIMQRLIACGAILNSGLKKFENENKTPVEEK
jgi:hypothetical protein